MKVLVYIFLYLSSQRTTRNISCFSETFKKSAKYIYITQVRKQENTSAHSQPPQPSKEWQTQKKDKDRRQGKGRRCCFGHGIASIPCRAIAIFHKDDLKNRMHLSYSPNRPGGIHPILQIPWCNYSSQHGKELNQLCPPSESDDLCLLVSVHTLGIRIM